MIQLTTKRLIIRDPEIDDFDGWHRLLSDAQNMYYLPDIATRTKEESCHNLEAAIADIMKPDRTKYFFAIEEKATGSFVGTVGYTVRETTPVGKSVGAGYFILPEFHGKGYVTEAFTEVIRFAFEENGVYRIETGCITENRASERVMQKCGLIKETFRKAYVWHDGQLKDRVEYRLLKDEWENMRKSFNKQKLIIITGSPCVGKTAVAEYLFERFENCAHFDGDWAWRVNPFSVEDPRLRNGDRTMSFALSTYLNSGFDYVIFSSVVVQGDEIRQKILSDITANGYTTIGFTLTCSEETLTERHRKRGDDNEVSFFWLRMEHHPCDHVINTDNKTVRQIAEEMKEIIDYNAQVKGNKNQC